MKRITIDDVAQKAGVSKSTVSAVMNAKKSVRPATKDHILGVMKELNFRPRGVARNLKNVSLDKAIAIITKDIYYPFYAAIAAGAKDYARDKGYALILASSDSNHENEKNLSHFFSVKDIKGTIICPVVEGTAEIEHLFKLKMLNYPFVLLEEVSGIQANVVTIDNIKAIKKAVKYLMEIGHKKIIHFAGPPHDSHAQERIEGFRYAFSESTSVFNKDMIVPIGDQYEGALSSTLDYFKKRTVGQYPTAIVCYNDHQALAVMTALRELNISVPGDISIVGNDDIYYSKDYPVALTTIRAPQYEIGRKAAEILIRNSESPKMLPVEKVVLETELIIRESTRVLNDR